MTTPTFRDELKLGSEIYSEELQRKINKIKRELDHIIALKKALEDNADDQKIKEITDEHKLFQKTKKREETKLKNENSVKYEPSRNYIENEISFYKLMNSYLKTLKHKNKEDQVLNRKSALLYINLHRPQSINY